MRPECQPPGRGMQAGPGRNLVTVGKYWCKQGSSLGWGEGDNLAWVTTHSCIRQLANWTEQREKREHRQSDYRQQCARELFGLKWMENGVSVERTLKPILKGWILHIPTPSAMFFRFIDSELTGEAMLWWNLSQLECAGDNNWCHMAHSAWPPLTSHVDTHTLITSLSHTRIINTHL